MKAAQIISYDQPVKFTTDVSEPSLAKDRVLVEVKSAGLNPFDVKLTQGFYKGIKLNLPATIGGDVSGVVKEIGEDVSGFEVGQEVFGMANAAGGQGSFAELTPVAASQLAPKPKSLNFVEAGAVPLTAVSAYQALVDHLDLQSGQKILIHGGAGGIGSLAIQLAKHLGAYVATTASVKEADFVKSLGADEVIDYQNQDFSQILQDYDAVFDTVGGETNKKSYAVLKNGGALTSMLEAPDETLAQEKAIKYTQQGSQATPERLAKITELFDSGVLKASVDRVFSLEQTAEAINYYLNDHPRGKVVVKVSD
jgi:NADPH:quinone reductase-like Zn-dependent oxidoreductase